MPGPEQFKGSQYTTEEEMNQVWELGFVPGVLMGARESRIYQDNGLDPRSVAAQRGETYNTPGPENPAANRPEKSGRPSEV